MKKHHRILSLRQPEDDANIYRESEVRDRLTPDEFTAYRNLSVEYHLNIAHLLLTALQVQKAKLLLKAFARESIRRVKSVRVVWQVRLIGGIHFDHRRVGGQKETFSC